MLSRFFGGRGVPQPDLTLDDVARHILDRAQPAAAFAELQRLDRLELIDVYLPAGWVAAGHRDFNVWLGSVMVPPLGRRMTLAEWCEQWLQDRASAPDGGPEGGAA
jgi:hypothetical protein